MPASDPAEILLAHNRWATRSVLECCATLPDEQFHQEVDEITARVEGKVDEVLRAIARRREERRRQAGDPV